MNYNLAVDLGNAIIDHKTFGTTSDFFLNGNYNAIPPVPAVFECLKKLNDSIVFKNRVYVVYNATDVADSKINNWMSYHQFHLKTGISANNIFRSRDGRNKLNFCRQFNITHFVDDRLEVLSHLVDSVPYLFLFNSQPQETVQFQTFLDRVTQSNSWLDLTSALINSEK